MENIINIANKIGINEENVEQYGKYKAKISLNEYKKLSANNDGKLILVTAINPTPLGEGKTTVSIGLCDGLNSIGKKAIATLREPSLGPVFGVKGGATGGGKSSIEPSDEINLHFTGDIHAITTANNLLSAIIDNHIFQGNELNIKDVTWKRCMDVNDRQLRKINTGLSGEKKIVERIDGFDITAASEIMAILCLSEDEKDLKRRLGNIIIGFNNIGKPVTANDLKAAGALTALLKDAIKPNLVQTLEASPVLIHGGPFANIAHGCNSIVATKMGLKLADYVVTEAGFGADLGAEKFLDIKTRKLPKNPDAVVIVATIRALKYHGGVGKENVQIENIDALVKGSKNLLKHIENIKDVFGLNAIVAINKFDTDTEKEISVLKEILNENNVELSLVECYTKGSKGSKDLAEKVVTICDKENNFKFAYSVEDSITEKIEKISKNIYGALEVEYSDEAKIQIKQIEELGYSSLPICIAKTQYSLSDDDKNLECEKEFNIHIKEVKLKAGAEFIVVLTGKIMTMPGLSKHPAYENINLDENGDIIGIF
ncbi:MAG: formate--tetrahydrofolate ligase [Clostridia bacterium]|nr:formate--tetrahydrofolate ligase [Clostridia bacterium]